jgi:hypothetical protein
MGIEPTLLAWKAKVLPLNYTRIKDGRDDTIRTCDPLVPNQVLYQAELRPDNINLIQLERACPERFELPTF